jgi:transglutaminase-like putative cysteine protease
MQIRVGYDIAYECPQPTPMILTLHIHYSRASDVLYPDHMSVSPAVPVSAYRDLFGNWCSRILAPPGIVTLSTRAVVRDSGKPDPVHLDAIEHRVQDLPEETLVFLLGSRYCETDRLNQAAWDLFAKVPPGWARVQAICDFVHHHIRFGYDQADPMMSAAGVFDKKRGVCRDFAHLAVAFCRCMNIPARYCTGYLGDIGMPPPYAAGDFAGWFEAYLGGAWHTFDPRNNIPRIGRVLIARGRDAADVAITSHFGPAILRNFNIVTDEVGVPAGEAAKVA